MKTSRPSLSDSRYSAPVCGRLTARLPIVVGSAAKASGLERTFIDPSLSSRKSMARGHGDYIVEPSVFFRGGLKEGHDAKIIIGRIDVLAPGNAIEHRLRPMPDALVSHSDKLLVISLQNKADVERSANHYRRRESCRAGGRLR